MAIPSIPDSNGPDLLTNLNAAFTQVYKDQQIQAATAVTTSGTAPNFTVALTPAITAYAEPLEFEVKLHSTGILGSNTINVNGVGSLNLMQIAADGKKIPADVIAGMVTRIRYDGTDAVVLNPLTTLGSLGAQSGLLSANFTLNNTHIGRMQILGSTGLTVTLPTTNTIPSGACFYLKNEGSGRASIALNGNTLMDSPGTSIEQGETVILQSDGGSTYRLVSRTSRGMPDYNNVASSGHTVGTVYQVDSDSTIIAVLSGSYVNGLRLLVGITSSPNIVVAQSGDDINSNTKNAFLTANIPKGWYFKYDNAVFSGPWETITSNVYRNH